MGFVRCGPRDQPDPELQSENSAINVLHLTKKFKIPHQRSLTVFDRFSAYIRRQPPLYEQFYALRDVNFQVHHGEALGIIGPNGSGKSTLLKLIAGVLRPDHGCISVDGTIAPFLELGVGFEPELSARENIYLYGAIMGISRREIDRKYWDILDFAELRRFEFLKLRNFSSGMYARLAFAIAFQANPDILLLDEVLAVGDESFQRKCMEKIEEIRRAGKTTLYVSHNLESVRVLCNRCILFQDGRIAAIGSPDLVIDHYHRNMESGHPSEIRQIPLDGSPE
jgi:lipopolysaccharide transport system ATP-binding protein